MKLNDAKRSLIVNHEIKLVKALAGNDPKLRDRTVKNLRKWFDHRSLKIPFTEQEFIRMWKGLFYAMWMSDKPLIQEECAEKIAHLVHFSNVEMSLSFFKCSLIVLTTEWFGIDQLRLNKFLMFVRRILRQALFVLKNNNWKLECLTCFGEILFETVLQNNNHNHVSLTMHIIEIYLEELAKVSKGEIDPSLMTVLLKPFIKHLATLNDARLITHTKKYLFNHLLQQSDPGMEYQAKFQAWKGEGFSGGTIDSMQNVLELDDAIRPDDNEDIQSDDDNQPLDPRAGEVDVFLPQLKFNSRQISKLLLDFKSEKGSTTKSRKALSDLAKKFKHLSKGNFPLGMKKIEIQNDGYSTNIRKSVNRLVKFEQQLLGNNRKRKLKDKKSDEPSKKIKIAETNVKENGINLFQKKLESFIKKSEGGKVKKTNKQKSNKTQSTLIKRNSGMWLVEPLDLPKATANFKEETTENNNFVEESVKSTTVFPQNEWDLAPKEGEVEIFVPSNKYKRKIEGIAKKSGKQASTLLKESLDKLAKPRYSLDSNLVRNPFSKKPSMTPRSEKKVKINLKLNSSQEIREHRAQILRSPAIPFDATKKPVKPLLKPNHLYSPINPFSKKKFL